MTEKKAEKKAKTEVGKFHTTKSGNKIKIMTFERDGCIIGRYVEVIKGHEFLQGSVQRWLSSGQWAQYPGGIHDIEWEKK